MSQKVTFVTFVILLTFVTIVTFVTFEALVIFVTILDQNPFWIRAEYILSESILDQKYIKFDNF